MDFLEHLAVTVPECGSKISDINNDFEREAAFTQQALQAAAAARKRICKAKLTFSRPAGYFSEMLKTQEHMTKIHKKMDDQRTKDKQADEARKQRHLKKFGKKIQVEKRLEREKQKADDLGKIAELRKKRRAVAQHEDDFDVQVDDEAEEPKHRKTQSWKREPSKRQTSKNDKFGFGGKKRGAKRNTSESTDTFDFSLQKNKQPFRGAVRKRTANRPGKARRQQMQSRKGARKSHK